MSNNAEIFQMTNFAISIFSCQDKTACQLIVNSDIFGEPCPGTFKYIEIHYSCIEKARSNSDAKPLAPWLLDLSATPPSMPTTPKPTTTTEFFEEEIVEETDLVSFDIDEEAVAVPDPEVFENEEVVEYPEEPIGYCPPINERGIFWNWTRNGHEAVRMCPPGSSGFAKWKCQNDGHWSADFPNLSNCQSNWIRRLDPKRTSFSYLLSKLDQYSSSRPLYGGDIPFIVRMLQVLPERLSQEMMSMNSQEDMELAASDLQEKVTKIASDLLEEIQMLAWQDLEPETRSKMVSGIFLGVTESNLVMAEVLNREKRVRISSRNVFADIRVKGSRNIEDQYLSDHDTFLLVKDSTLAEASVNGAIRIGYFTFKNLEYILPGLEDHFINSEVIGAAIPNNNDEVLETPVQFTLKHKLSKEAQNPVCVAWSYRTNSWNSENCEVEKTTPTHTSCKCNRLSQYAILMEALPSLSAQPQSSNFGTFEKLDVILVLSFLLASSFLLLSVAVIIAKRKKFCSKSSENNKNTDNSLFYPPSTHYASALKPHVNNEQQLHQQNGPHIIYQGSVANGIPFNAELYGHIYSEISNASSPTTYLSYLNEGSETQSDISSEDFVQLRGSPTFFKPLLGSQKNNHYRASNSNPQVPQQQQLMSSSREQATLRRSQLRFSNQPLALTTSANPSQIDSSSLALARLTNDRDQFVRLRTDDYNASVETLRSVQQFQGNNRR